MSAFDYDKIIRYVDGEMPSQEREAFDLSLQRDEALRNEVEQYRNMKTSLQTNFYPDQGEQALRAKIREIQPDYFRTKTKVVSFSLQKLSWRLASAAAILILALFLWEPWKEDLFSQYVATRMPAIAERGIPSDSLLQSASEKFNSGKFSESIVDFGSLIQRDSGNAYIQFYYAIALLETKQTNVSRIYLARLYDGNSLFRYDAAFYLALSYLKEKDNGSAKVWLQKIPADASVYPRANELLRKLR